MKNLSLLLIAVFSLGINGCMENQGSPSDNNKPTQVAAKVGSKEITINELNLALNRVQIKGSLNEEQKEEIQSRVLNDLINQKILLEAAKQKKIDRDPNTLSLIEDAKNKIIIQAYIQKTIPAYTPSEEEIKTYYKNNKNKFENRKLFVIDQIMVINLREPYEDFFNKIKDIKSLDSAINFLTEENYRFEKKRTASTSEQLNEKFISILTKLGNGDIGALKSGENDVLILNLASSQPLPVDTSIANNSIKNHLITENKKAYLKNLVNGLKDELQIEYLNGFKAPESKE